AKELEAQRTFGLRLHATRAAEFAVPAPALSSHQMVEPRLDAGAHVGTGVPFALSPISVCAVLTLELAGLPLAESVQHVLDGLVEMTLEETYQPGQDIDLPRLCVTTEQNHRATK